MSFHHWLVFLERLIGRRSDAAGLGGNSFYADPVLHPCCSECMPTAAVPQGGWQGGWGAAKGYSW